jgi:two-component system KDP operon response regulator KdpE
LPQILVIDDDPGLLSVCSVGLQALGHTVRTAETGQEGISQAAVHAPDVIVLDLGLPDLDGLVVCKRIRTWSEVPIIVLSADGSEDRKVDALDHGADDYMTKPFGMRELHARVQVALRHHRAEHGGEEQPAELDVGSLHLDLVHRQATFDGRRLDLRPREFDFLAYLARNAGQVCTRRMILENVWGPGYASEIPYLKVYAYRIRRKLHDEQGRFLQSDPSVGYRLAWPSGSEALGQAPGISSTRNPTRAGRGRG